LTAEGAGHPFWDAVVTTIVGGHGDWPDTPSGRYTPPSAYFTQEFPYVPFVEHTNVIRPFLPLGIPEETFQIFGVEFYGAGAFALGYLDCILAKLDIGVYTRDTG
jgi:hypothetical protein